MKDLFQIPQNKLIFKEGDDAKDFYLIRSGEVLLCRIQDERLYPLGIMESGDTIGEESAFTDKKRHYNAISLDTTELIRVGFDEVFTSIEKYPHWVEALLQNLGRRVQNISDLVCEQKIRDINFSRNHTKEIDLANMEREVFLREIIQNQTPQF